MIKCSDIFNDKTLNIFTDASIRVVKDETIGASGYIAVIGNDAIHQDIRVLRESTNNQSEIYAVYMAIQYALLNRDKVKVINIFSDSQFAIFGLREWVFSWMNNIRGDRLYNSSNKPVSNQNIFMAILYTIINYNLEINLYHNMGHYKDEKVVEFIQLFKKHNQINDYLEKEIGYKIIYFNNKIDMLTRNVLWTTEFPNKLEILDYYARTDLDMNQYRNLLNI